MRGRDYNKAMKKTLLLIICCLLLTACERSATLTDWSPINDVGTPLPTALSSATPQETPLPAATKESPTPAPTVQLSTLPDPLPESFKGYELVSWQTGDDWNFTLVTGTNRSKTCEELMSPESQVSEDGFVKITVTGVSQIKKVFDLLPENTQVFWSGMDLSGQVPEGTVYFSYPSEKTINDLMTYAVRQNIDLVVLAEPE